MKLSDDETIAELHSLVKQAEWRQAVTHVIMWTMTLRTLLALTFMGLVIGVAGITRAAEDTDPIVVELFTSQGCSSCPPADQFLGELAKQPGILALSFHVDYWDYIGWKDPFASHQATQRQRKYAQAFDIAYVYTPQMVVQGRAQGVGSDRSDIEAEIAKQRRERVAHPSLTLERRNEGSLAVRVGAGSTQETATVWLVCYDRHHETQVPRGENAGETLIDYHVVRHLKAIGTWNGEALDLEVPATDVGDFVSNPNGAIAVLVQSAETGPILAAGVLHDRQ